MGSGSKIGVGVVIGIIAVVGFIYIMNNTSGISQSVHPTVTVNGVDVVINYQGTTSGYLGATSQTLNGFSASAGSTYSYTITIDTSALLLDHSINSVTVSTSGFSISSVSPTLPYSFSPGSTIDITVTINLPSTSFNGVMELEIDTT